MPIRPLGAGHRAILHDISCRRDFGLVDGDRDTVLEHLIDDARARGRKAISLGVEDGNRARHLYERAGFTVVGRNGGSDTMLLKLR
jgi:GNAT superfamily N-acetyltransferase